MKTIIYENVAGETDKEKIRLILGRIYVEVKGVGPEYSIFSKIYDELVATARVEGRKVIFEINNTDLGEQLVNALVWKYKTITIDFEKN